jgi:hypothetical protein
MLTKFIYLYDQDLERELANLATNVAVAAIYQPLHDVIEVLL